MSETSINAKNHAGLPIVYRPGDPLAGVDSAELGSRKPKASEVTAELIVRTMVENGVKVGDRMPAESEMIESYQVSRETIREALRILESQGVLRIKRGPGGGPFVNAINAGFLARASSLYFHLAGSTYGEIFETWASIEPIMSAEAAAHPDKAWKSELLSPFLHVDPHEHTRDQIITELNDFHSVVALISGNRVLTLIVQSINHLVVHQVLQRLDPTNMAEVNVHMHHEIARAIIDGNSGKARDLMEQHLRDVIETARISKPEMMSEPIEWR